MGVGYKYSCSVCEYDEVVSPDQFYVTGDDGYKSRCDSENIDLLHELLAEWAGLKTQQEQDAFEKKRSGYGSDHLCLDCLKSWFMDEGTDPNNCPACKSTNIKAKWYLKDDTCPHCNKGVITSGLEPDWIS